MTSVVCASLNSRSTKPATSVPISAAAARTGITSSIPARRTASWCGSSVSGRRSQVCDRGAAMTIGTEETNTACTRPIAM